MIMILILIRSLFGLAFLFGGCWGRCVAWSPSAADCELSAITSTGCIAVRVDSRLDEEKNGVDGRVS